jgi:hypothetical protein
LAQQPMKLYWIATPSSYSAGNKTAVSDELPIW